jgi:hypothetical protein
MAKENYPSGYYICCWRMFRARRLANQFHITEQTVATFETGKCLLFVVLLVIIKFIVLNIIAIAPFVLAKKDPEEQNSKELSRMLEVDQNA